MTHGLKVDGREQPGTEAGASVSAVDARDCLASRFSPSPNTHERLVLPSPQPPPSLSYADSGFHEPSDFDDMLPAPHQPVSEQERVPSERQHNQRLVATMSKSEHVAEEQTAQQIVPPTLERSDTSFRIPQEPSGPESRGTETPRAEAAHTPITLPAGATPNDNVPPQTTTPAVLNNESEPVSRESTPLARLEENEAPLIVPKAIAHNASLERSEEAAASTAAVSDAPKTSGDQVSGD
ncbi:uncharacterized protein AB675_8226 [Cyphellophora attinorum]|uniref:Uncharacterized protein n=1 Tax=Cyphellophora attinorum TaxID=1664694 RepID=A0A0N1HAM5_9EURO|nr:uncharacterized protein AB675_8226 [Phialophora attinorum]KPI41076.1 hypothetical protein AB675_8226 [Phialophora attinorum]